MLCDSCRQDAPLREAEFGLTIGLVIGSYQTTKKGRLCSGCIHETFWVYTLLTLVLGWWDLKAFFLTPVWVVLNVVSYCGLTPSIRSQSPSPRTFFRSCDAATTR